MPRATGPCTLIEKGELHERRIPLLDQRNLYLLGFPSQGSKEQYHVCFCLSGRCQSIHMPIHSMHVLFQRIGVPLSGLETPELQL